MVKIPVTKLLRSSIRSTSAQAEFAYPKVKHFPMECYHLSLFWRVDVAASVLPFIKRKDFVDTGKINEWIWYLIGSRQSESPLMKGCPGFHFHTSGIRLASFSIDSVLLNR